MGFYWIRKYNSADCPVLCLVYDQGKSGNKPDDADRIESN